MPDQPSRMPRRRALLASLAAASALAAPSLHFSTGIAIAFARSPMITAQIAWELAQNTQGRFRLGLGSQVKAHITKRYGSTFDKPAPQRFWEMLKRYAVLDLGTSYMHHKSVWQLIVEKLPVSISLGVWSFLIVYAVSELIKLCSRNNHAGR